MRGQAEHVRALLVEDNPADARLVREFARDCQHIVLEIEHVDRLQAAIDRLPTSQFDVILLDLGLPDAMGVETLMRVHDAAPRIPVIVMTGNASDSLAIDAARTGAQDYLVKGSFDVTLLERSIRYAVGRWQTMLALGESEERYALAVEGANDGIWDWNIDRNTVYYSPRWKAMVGYAPEEIDSSPEQWLSRIHPDDATRVQELIDDHLSGKAPDLSAEYRIRHRDGSFRWVLSRGLAVRNAGGKAYRLAGSQSDISARKQAEAQLLHSAFHDDLTELPNRAQLLERVEEALRRHERRPDTCFAVLSLKIDRFHMINDSFGYAAGDQVIRKLGMRLAAAEQPGDLVARIGGAQFAVLLANPGSVEAVMSAISVFQAELSRPISVERGDVATPASIGVTTSADGHTRAEDYLRSAEIAMHRARTLGGARCEVFGAEMHAHLSARLQLEREIRQGIEREEFCWYYQPLVCLVTGRILGFEALMRWRHPERGLVPPGQFVRLVEETSLLGPLFRHLFPVAVAQLGQWQRRFPQSPALFVNVNVSASQISDPHLLEVIDQAMATHPCEPYSLGLELTEEGAMGDTALPVLKQLKERRLRLVLDDFGTGYSSLSRLQRFPIDELKIDRSFVAGLPKNPESTAITRAIITLAHALGMGVTAEGIESADQLRAIQQLRCEHGQGFLFSRPESARSFSTMHYRQFFQETGAEAQPNRGRIMLVDDDPANRRLMELQLAEEGFAVQTATSGQECLHGVIAERPDVVMLDIQMPGLDGIATCKRLKDNPETSDIPVLFITGHRDDDPTVVRALSAGGNDFLSKDAPIPVLLARVETQIAISRANERMRNLAMTDELTGLHSRRFLFEALRRAIKATARKRRGDEGLACLMIDIDHFKRVNDFHGHVAGDDLLRRVAETVVAATRETDRVARFGGEEFVVILPDTDVDGAATVAERIRKAVPTACGGTTVSVGLAHMPPTHVDMDLIGTTEKDPVQRALTEILQRADEAMYTAKTQGRNRVAIHQQDLPRRRLPAS